MVQPMASQSFFQPVSSWISRMYDAVSLAGDSTSGSLNNLNKAQPSVASNQDSQFQEYQEQFEYHIEEFPEEKQCFSDNDFENNEVTSEHDENNDQSLCTTGNNELPRDAARSSIAETSMVCRLSTIVDEDDGALDTLSSITSEGDLDQIRTLLRNIDSPTFSSLGITNGKEFCKDLDVLNYQSNEEDEHVSYSSKQETAAVEHEDANGQETDARPGVSNNGLEDATDNSSVCSPEDQVDGTLPPPIHVPICKCGDLDVTLEYKPSNHKLVVTVLEAKDIPDKERSGVDSWQVHVVVLPSKKQRGKTTTQKGSLPVFNETFTFIKLMPEEMPNSALRFRLYAVHKMNRIKMMGEKLCHLRNIRPDTENSLTLVLEPISNLSSGDSLLSLTPVSHSESDSSTQSLSHGGVPELLVGLSYNPTTGRLSVEIIKGSHFRNLAVNRPPDTYGKLSLLDSAGHEISRCKTSVRRGQPNPVYKETFIFQIAFFQLTDFTLMISIYNRRNMKRKEMIGWLSLGKNSSGEEEQNHWMEMIESKGQQVCHWHMLLES